MPDAGEIRQTSADALRAAASRARWLASAAAEQSVWAARAGYELAATCASGGVQTLGQARELLPVMQRYLSTTHRVLEELKRSEAFRLRRLEDLPGIADYLTQLGDELEALASELRLIPRSAAAALAIGALRVAAALNSVCDAALWEMLHGRALLSRLALLSSVAPGWLLLFHYRGALLEGVPVRRPALAGGGADECQLVLRVQSAARLARNARRMPPAFWLAAAASGTVVLHVVKEQCVRLVRRLFRLRLRGALLLAALAAALSRCGLPGALEFLSEAWAELSGRASEEALTPRSQRRRQPPLPPLQMPC